MRKFPQESSGAAHTVQHQGQHPLGGRHAGLAARAASKRGQHGNQRTYIDDRDRGLAETRLDSSHQERAHHLSETPARRYKADVVRIDDAAAGGKREVLLDLTCVESSTRNIAS